MAETKIYTFFDFDEALKKAIEIKEKQNDPALNRACLQHVFSTVCARTAKVDHIEFYAQGQELARDMVTFIERLTGKELFSGLPHEQAELEKRSLANTAFIRAAHNTNLSRGEVIARVTRPDCIDGDQSVWTGAMEELGLPSRTTINEYAKLKTPI